MINKQGLLKIIAMTECGVKLLPGEVAILRDAVELLDDLASTLDKIMEGERILKKYDLESTQQLKIIEQGKITTDDDHGGNRP